MVKRLRTTSFAGFGAILLVLIVSGMVAAASLLTAIAAPEPDPVGPAAVDTTQTFEDANANGIDDDCETGVVADEAAAAAADTAADLNGDGTVSVSEAAQSGRVGQIYVMGGDGFQPELDLMRAHQGRRGPTRFLNEAPPAPDTAATCVATPPTGDTAPTDTTTTDTPKNHGAVVSVVAGSTAVGGKNCNHGGAVSEASHKDNEARKAARDAAKAAKDAARAAKHAAKGHGH
jgi:hypothetical protein